MRKIILTIFASLFLTLGINAQNIVKGIVTDSNSGNPLQGVLVSILNTASIQNTGDDGIFILKDLPNGSYIVALKLIGYESQNFPIELTGKTIDLGTILFYKDANQSLDLSLISLSDDELNDDSGAADNIAGLLQATQDVFLRTAAFEFSSSFFSIKGLDSGNGKVLVNGIEMNKLYDGRAQWSNWGGLNDVLRNQEFNNGLSPSAFTFGGVLGSTNINTRASQQRPGVRVSYASSNRSYVHRVMATYSTGIREDGWAMTFSGSRRSGIEGFNDGSSYDAYSLFASIEKKINKKHSINFTSIFAPNKRGKSSPNTQEVYDLKDIKYNEYWGYLNGNKINSRIKNVEEPILMLNHYWDISENTSLYTNFAYQFGKIGNSRLDFNGGANPSPVYYQKLPSYFLSKEDLAGAYESLQNFQNDGQIDWNRIYDANITNASVGINNAYVFYEDRNDDKQLTLNSILNSQINNNITLNAKLEARTMYSKNFASVLDLLGGIGYLDINPFADSSDKMQNNLLNQNNVIREGDKFKYNYTLVSGVVSAFTQLQFKYKKIDFFTAFNISNTTHQRRGLFQNGRFPNNSLGLSEIIDFTNFGLKGGATYKITGRHLLDANVAYMTQAPTIRNSFSNSRENNNVVENLQSEKIFSFDASYIVRSPIITSRITGFYNYIQDATEISFFFADGISGDNRDNNFFVQEILNGIDKKHLGVELGLEAQVTPTIKLKGAASIGQYTYANNPNLYLTSDVANKASFNNKFRTIDYVSNLKNYRLASGPQNAYSVGFEYRDPDYWWFGTTANFFSNIFVDVAPLNRTSNFYTDDDGLPFNDYDPALARELLQQERFDDYMVVNLIGGKSWKINDKFISVFATVNNLLNQEYKSGGFEQGRNANFRQLKDDKALDTPVFGNKYWYGRGTTYFLNVNLRF
ncbi:MAG: TonB-dependent receptor [Flavobacteriia bacterium]|nr:TonB-dependent receptor [Flavobacteriia bacterium]OIP46440.1 MAG: TonB-dependent receptor [Flavobacteriaceae bacterium CG2_30_31_66]PIV96549.1 MAG: TonB-dependent receptor [Flavobacteriaceae bacterium CG17_big_fil_post_rev_8_21_14_2_50_31_13]PIX12442.1 MAG: TonB-dependent receptor [Flavobacteriaceae bacterium CG_4_8_14_3_um_filter_31_8]PIY16071.1 MAG: TonB-dependent receptor [Flavobacteriaceae bacterium CG_4_10_14_3_um_filter_31_253]PIZ09920.1 MAG: TonB-dependent receptor [Flavobacteriaceae